MRHHRARCKAQTSSATYLEKGREIWERCSSASSDRDTISLSPETSTTFPKPVLTTRYGWCTPAVPSLGNRTGPADTADSEETLRLSSQLSNVSTGKSFSALRRHIVELPHQGGEEG